MSSRIRSEKWSKCSDCDITMLKTYNYFKAKCTTDKLKKRSHENDIPPSPSMDNTAQLEAYKQLESVIQWQAALWTLLCRSN